MASPYRIAALYKFVALPDFRALQARILEAARAHRLCGSLLLAEEGINGTIAGAPAELDAFLGWLRADPRFADLGAKFSEAEETPFLRMKVRLKREIVSMGAPGVVRPETVGQYVAPPAWNALVDDPEVVVIDTRNDYEVALGRFDGAVDPLTRRFRDFPAWAEAARDRLKTAKAVAMYCTGGIRCEKATAFVRSLGAERVYHLDGGVLRYLETVPAEESRWRGRCFVFDRRVSVGHGLTPGEDALCHGCRMPVTPEERASPDYVPGVSCRRCAESLTPERAARLAERERQVALAEARGLSHLGAPSSHPAKRAQ